MLTFLFRSVLCAFVAGLAACQTIGADSVQRDRLDYATAIGDSWKEQALLNIVKLRYFDPPVFLDVSSVISSYTLQGQLSLGARIFRSSPEDTFRESACRVPISTGRPLPTPR